MIPHSKVFVGGLPTGSRPHELRRLFENFGVVTECDVRNHCGFVHMENPQMAENAIRALHNTFFKGSAITVEAGRFGGRGSGGGDAEMDRGGPNPRMGGEGNISSGPPRGNFGNTRDREFGGQRGGGPIRHGRGGRGGGDNQRGGAPYNRNSPGDRAGGGNFNDYFESSGDDNRFDSSRGPANFNQNPMNTFAIEDDNIVTGRFRGGGNYGMGHQNQRFGSLPDESFSDNRGPIMRSNQDMGMSQVGAGGFSENMNTFNRAGRGGGRGGMRGGRGRGSFGNNENNYNNRPIGGNMNTNQSEGQFGGQSRGGNRFTPTGNQSRANRGNSGEFSNDQNYNESFPPLGSQRGNNSRRGGGSSGFNQYGSGRGGGAGISRGGNSTNGDFNRGRGRGGYGNRGSSGPSRRDNMMSNLRQ